MRTILRNVQNAMTKQKTKIPMINILNLSKARKSNFESLSYVRFFGTLVCDVVTLCKEIFCVCDVTRMHILIHPCSVQVLFDCIETFEKKVACLFTK